MEEVWGVYDEMLSILRAELEDTLSANIPMPDIVSVLEISTYPTTNAISNAATTIPIMEYNVLFFISISMERYRDTIN